MFDFILNYIRELDSLQEKQKTCKGKDEEWQPPNGMLLKINFDAAYDTQHRKSTSGIVVRNGTGEVLVSKSQIHYEVGSAFATQALACIRGDDNS